MSCGSEKNMWSHLEPAGMHGTDADPIQQLQKLAEPGDKWFRLLVIIYSLIIKLIGLVLQVRIIFKIFEWVYKCFCVYGIISQIWISTACAQAFSSFRLSVHEHSALRVIDFILSDPTRVTFFHHMNAFVCSDEAGKLQKVTYKFVQVHYWRVRKTFQTQELWICEQWWSASKF